MDTGRICVARRKVYICSTPLCKGSSPGTYLGGRLLEHAPWKVGVGEGALGKVIRVAGYRFQVTSCRFQVHNSKHIRKYLS